MIREIEASTVGAERLDLGPRGNVLNLPSGKGLLRQGYINGKCMGDDPLMALLGPAARGGQDDDPTGGTGNLLNETKKGGSVQRPSGFQRWAPSRRKWPSSGISSLRQRRSHFGSRLSGSNWGVQLPSLGRTLSSMPCPTAQLRLTSPCCLEPMATVLGMLPHGRKARVQPVRLHLWALFPLC